jgi:NAD(P)-dependent dehydrogenase (short-subunit alcohol dehydrogenase family)
MTPTALITGGTSGIGRATASKLAQLGLHVLVVGRSLERGEKAIAEIRKAGGQADFIPSDLRDGSSARAVARKALDIANGQIDILINNAGIYPFASTHETSEEAFDNVYALNVKARHQFLSASTCEARHRYKGPCITPSFTQTSGPGRSHGQEVQGWRSRELEFGSRTGARKNR